jgi:hypothetical protein
VAAPQFGVGHLLSWTAAAALLLVITLSPIGREIWASDWSLSSGDWVGISFWISLWATLCVLQALPILWACLGEPSPSRRLAGVGLYAAIVVACEWVILMAVAGDNRMGTCVLGLNVGIMGQVVTGALLLRSCGFRTLFTRAQSAA